MRIYGHKCTFVLNSDTFVFFLSSLSKELQRCQAQQACMPVNSCFLFFSKGLFDESGKTRDTRNIIIKNSVRVHEVRMNSFTTLFYYNVCICTSYSQNFISSLKILLLLFQDYPSNLPLPIQRLLKQRSQIKQKIRHQI